MKLDTETLRQLVMEYLKGCVKNRRTHDMQWTYVLGNVSTKVRERWPQYQSPHDKLNDGDAIRLKHVVWDLIIERILVPSTSNPTTVNDGWPFLSLTEHGLAVIDAQRAVPYDPDGYITSLKATSPSVSQTVIDYVDEAAATFRSGNFLASAIMIGAASEMIFNELCAAIPPVLDDTAARDKLAEKLSKGKMQVRIKTIVGWCRGHKVLLPSTWSSDEQVEDIERIADLIRRRRNEAGHPQDPPLRPSREQMYSYLMVFPEYCKHLYVLKDWAKGNVGTIN